MQLTLGETSHLHAGGGRQVGMDHAVVPGKVSDRVCGKAGGRELTGALAAAGECLAGKLVRTHGWHTAG